MTPRLSASITRTLLRATAAIALALGLLSARVIYSARTELDSAHAALAGGDIDRATVHYRRAARFYAPGSPYHVQALQRLDAIGTRAEQGGDIELALSAQRAIRGAIFAARSLYVPERARLATANAHIARLMAELPPPGMDAGKPKPQLEAEHLALLSAEPDPDPLWTCVLLLGFIAWVSAAFAFSQRAIDADDRFVMTEVRTWGAVIVVGFGMFALGMALA
jgi:hypothetical protein